MASFGASTEVLAAQISVPLELKEAVCTICWAAPFLDNSSELLKIRAIMLEKYRTDDHLRQSTFVHKKVLLGLSHDMPADSLIDYYLSNILNEHETPDVIPTAKSRPEQATPSATPATLSAAPAPSKLPAMPASTPLKPLSSHYTGTIRIDTQGHAWLLPDDQTPPIFISPSALFGAKDFDRANVAVDQRRDGKRSGRLESILSSVAPTAPSRLPAEPKGKEKRRVTFIGTATGALRLDSLGHAWVTDAKFPSPIFVPNASIDSPPADPVLIQVFELHGKLIGVLVARAASSILDEPLPLEPSSGPESDNDALKMVDWIPVPHTELTGLFKSESDEFGLVLPSELGAGPVVVIGSVHRNSAASGDKVRVLVFGEATNPSSGTTYPLGRIVHTLGPASTAPLASSSKPARDPVTLVSADAGDFSAPLELDENGNGRILHPTLPWTYVIIPREELKHTIAGDTIAVQLDGSKPSRGQLAGRFVGIVEAYSAEHSIEVSLHDSNSFEKALLGLDSADKLEEDLQPLADFEIDPSSLSRQMDDIRISPKDVIVIDFGSGYIKIGGANQPVPIFSIPTLAGRLQDSLLPQQANASANKDSSDLVVGESALERRALLSIERPFERGQGKDWSAIRALLYKALGNSVGDLRRASVVLMESEVGPWLENRAEFADICFELGVPHLVFAHPSPCALLSERKVDGIVIDMGHTSTVISVVENGRMIEGLKTSYPITGLDITSRLASLLSEDGYRMWRSESQKVALEAMKQSVAFVRPLSLRDSSSSPLRSERAGDQPPKGSDISYKLNDGMEVIVGDRAWQCMEILFNPSSVGLDCPSLPEVIMGVLTKVRSPDSMASKHSEDLLLIGGASLVPGLRQRLQSEIHALEQRSGSVERPYIEQPPKAQFSTWIGGSLLALSPSFASRMITPVQYRKFGKDILRS